MKSLSAAFVVALLAVPAVAVPSPESALTSAEKSFQRLSAFKACFQRGSAQAQAVAPGRAVPVLTAQAAPASYVRVSGQISLSGSGYVPNGSGFVTISLSGSTNLQDASGRIRSGYTHVSTYASLFVSGPYASTWVRPDAYVSFYKDGRYVGSARVDGNVLASGWVNGGWLTLTGSGTLNGDLVVQE